MAACNSPASSQDSSEDSFREGFAMKILDDDIEYDIHFLGRIAQRCWWISLMQFSMIPLIFGLAQLLPRISCCLMFLETVVSMALQLHIKADVVRWMQQHEGWQDHVVSITDVSNQSSLRFCSKIFTYLVSMMEALDPSLDAWTASNAQHMCYPSVCSRFEKAWEPIPMARDAIAWLGGLHGILLLLLCVSTLFQLIEFAIKGQQLRGSLERMSLSFPFPDQDTAALARWRVWIYLSHLTDVGGVILLQDLFLKLVEVEISLSHQVWPVPDRNAAFRSKVMMEAVPALWLQISLLNLTLGSISTWSMTVTCLSIAFSFCNILKHLLLVSRALLHGLGFAETSSSRGSACYNVQLSGMFGIALCVVLACVIRLFGTWLCPSHILNISTGCVDV